MVVQGDCPNEVELAKLAIGDLLQDDFELSCLHVESCPTCQARLAEIENHRDYFVRSMARMSEADLSKAGVELEAASKTGSLGFDNLVSEKGPRGFFQTTLHPPCSLGPYEVRRLIGHGGMGEVYEAKHLRLDRFVALKVIRGYKLDDPISHDRFLKEMANAGKLDHPNIVRAHDAWEEDGCLYLVFELLEGKSLQVLFGQEKEQKISDVFDSMLGICAALEHLHSLQLIHCDVKPANIIRLPDGTIKLIDIGLAIGFDLPISGSRIGSGTKGYLAPEQESGSAPIDSRSDIYSLGCVLGFMLKGLKKEIKEDPKSTAFCDLNLLAHKMTKFAPVERPQSVAEVRMELLNLRALATKGGFRPWRTLSITGLFGVLIVGLLLFAFPYWKPNPAQSNGSLEPPPAAGAVKPEGEGNPGANDQGDGSNLKGSTEAKKPEPGEKPIVMKVVTIPAGSFVMGASVLDDAPQLNEFPTRTIKISKPFQMGTYEVTVGQFTEFVKATGYKTYAESSESGGWKASTSSSWGTQNRDFNWTNPGYETAPTLPVTMVTYEDANAFCAWLSQRDGQKYRLPTETEWEYACRAGSTGIFPFPIEDRDSYCWSLWNVKLTVYPRPVGIRQPNPWGLYDMTGNVREWCHDWYGENAYKQVYESAPMGPAQGTLRIYRGGCFMDLDLFLRASHRSYLTPTDVLNNQGFRVVKEFP